MISIVMPVWNPSCYELREAIRSVRAQKYQHWELCVADGGSSAKYVKKILSKYARKDPRILVRYLPKNLGIAGNTNEAIAMASGDFVAFLDHDDELHPTALSQVVKLLRQHPDADLIYTDENHIAGKTKHYRKPHYKSDWNPDLLLSCNYICHLTVIRKSLLQDVGGMREGFEGAQDYDLILRCTEKTKKIHHIPEVLYHWRCSENSTAHSTSRKPYATQSALKALRAAFERRKVAIQNIYVAHSAGFYGVRYQISDPDLVSIIIATRDKSEVLEKCVSSILRQTVYPNYEILIIDNRSQEKRTFDYLRTVSLDVRVKVLEYEPEFNFSEINNFAARHASGKYLLFLNNDTEVINEDWMDAMVEHCQREEVGAVGAKLLYPDHRLQHAGVILGIGGVAGHSHKYKPDSDTGYFFRPHITQNFNAVTGACMMIRKQVFMDIGAFEKMLAVAFNDVDLCIRLRQKGYLVVYTPEARLYHLESHSRKSDLHSQRFAKECQLMREKWGEVLKKDAYYNPHLSYFSESFSFTQPELEKTWPLQKKISWIRRSIEDRYPFLLRWTVPEDFDWNIYVKRYPDLQRAGIDSREKAVRHWIRRGKKEGRSYKLETVPADFDWKVYVRNYPDLQNHGVDTKEKAMTHWLAYGRNEGRTYKKIVLPKDFDWTIYLENYPDLRNQGIDTEEKVVTHWTLYGYREGRTHKRILVPRDFNWKTYLHNCPDLVEFGIDTEEKAIRHWKEFGCREGRSYKKPLDLGRFFKSIAKIFRKEISTDEFNDISLVYNEEFIRTALNPKRWTDEFCKMITEYFNPRSVIDLGCGTGDVLASFEKRGIKVRGVDGNRLNKSFLSIRRKNFQVFDLRAPYYPKERHDLCLCLEVAEHIDETYAEVLIGSIQRSSSAVIFTAAPPGQQGVLHVNCKPGEWWIDLFRHHGYEYQDEFTEKLKAKMREIPSIQDYYINNLLVFLEKVEQSTASQSVLRDGVGVPS